MPKSIRISDELYEQVQTSAVLMHRSLNQQIEYWAALGQMADKQMSGDDLAAIMIARGHAQDEQDARSGKLCQEDLFAFKPDAVKKMSVHLSADAVDDFVL